MMRGLKRTINLMLCTALVMSLLTGCTPPNRGEEMVNTEVSVSEQQEQTNVSEEVTSDCPEGYVYDYQVSMEPIPEEIAALGGPCQGTMHAYPSKIAMALTELEMEKDPVLKEEVEKRIPEIEAALEEEIGGDFVVDGVVILNECDWFFFCTEVEAEYQFDIFYMNNEYYAKKNDGIAVDNRLCIENYYDEKDSVVHREKIKQIIEKIYEGADSMVRSQYGVNTLDIIIAQYTEEVDKVKEQEKLLMLWDELKKYDPNMDYSLSLSFYAPEYKCVIEEKYRTMFRYDVSSIYSEQIVLRMIEAGDVKGSLDYYSFINKNNSNNFDVLLQQYKSGKYDETMIFEYWIQ